MTLYAMPGPTPGERQTGIIDPVLHAEREGEKMQRLADAEQHKGAWKWDTGPANPERQRAYFKLADCQHVLDTLRRYRDLLFTCGSDDAVRTVGEEERRAFKRAGYALESSITAAIKARNAAQDKYNLLKGDRS